MILKQCLKWFTSPVIQEFKPQLITSNINNLPCLLQTIKHFSTTSIVQKWLDNNDKFFPIQGPNEKRRPAYVCHSIENVRYSPKKMWYVAIHIRGMSVDEALKQLAFLPKKGASIVKDAVLEAQRLAVEEHNVEFKSNLWVAESFCTKGIVIKGLRRHAKGRRGIIHYRYCHYYVRLEEGKPPKEYYLPYKKTGDELLEDWMTKMRKRSVNYSL